MILLVRIISFPFRLLSVGLLLIVYGETAAQEFEEGVQAFFDGLR